MGKVPNCHYSLGRSAKLRSHFRLRQVHATASQGVRGAMSCPGQPPDQGPLAKRRCLRPDVTVHREMNKSCKFATVKMRLAGFLMKAGKALPWAEVLSDMNQLAAEAWLLAKHHVVRAVREGSAVPTLDAKLFNQCIRAVSCRPELRRNSTVTPKFRMTAAEYERWRSSSLLGASCKQRVSV